MIIRSIIYRTIIKKHAKQIEDTPSSSNGKLSFLQTICIERLKRK